MKTNEIWKEIAGYPGYMVSNIGRVRGLRVSTLKPLETNKGYVRVALVKKGKPKFHYIHRLVATAFLDNSDKFPEVNHLNGIKADNRVDNLEWTTRKWNERHKIDTLGKNVRGENNGRAKLTEAVVKEIYSRYLSGERAQVLSEEYSVPLPTVEGILYGKSWKHVTGLNTEIRYDC